MTSFIQTDTEKSHSLATTPLQLGTEILHKLTYS